VPLWAQTLPPPVHGVPGRVRIAGTPGMAAVATAWVRAFKVGHPGIDISLAMRGSDIAMAGLYTATADIALIGRPATRPEIQAFEWVYRFRPTSVPVLRGSVATPGRSPAIAVMVHRDNPLALLRVEQLAAAFGDGGALAARRWGDLGLDGAWRDRPINLYAPDAESGTGRFFRAAVLGDSNRMAWPRLREFPVPPRPESAEAAVAAAMRRALAKDRAGLAVGVWGGDAAVRAVPLIGADGTAHALDAATVRSGAYPLARDVHACFAAAPARAPHVGTLAFLRFILSDEGQAIAAAAGDYLPLPAGAAQEASAALG
jgi:phosphate transport system substrate-binding protein